jgi:hypothetical protein
MIIFKTKIHNPIHSLLVLKMYQKQRLRRHGKTSRRMLSKTVESNIKLGTHNQTF